jgi:hypothetical protein
VVQWLDDLRVIVAWIINSGWEIMLTFIVSPVFGHQTNNYLHFVSLESIADEVRIA